MARRSKRAKVGRKHPGRHPLHGGMEHEGGRRKSKRTRKRSSKRSMSRRSRKR